MRNTRTYTYDAASALFIGQRSDQQDALSKDFVSAPGVGFAVVADGMGGHAAGDVASRIVVNEVFRHLRALAANPATMEENLKGSLEESLQNANSVMETVSKARPELEGMGSTVIAPIVAENRLYWVSVGDSPLYLLRESSLFRLNENHSVAGLLDTLVAEGEVDAGFAHQHPERHCLTSVINGANIPHIDSRKAPFLLENGDILIAASDGLQSIGDKEIARIVFEMRELTADKITDGLLNAVKQHDDPDQDNVSICVFKVSVAEQATLIDPLIHSNVETIDSNTPAYAAKLDKEQFREIYRRARGAKA